MTLQLPGRTAQDVTIRLVGSYPTFSPLPRLNGAVVFFCVSPAVTDTLHINKRDALCCPDFPHTPQGSKRQTVQLFSSVIIYPLFGYLRNQPSHLRRMTPKTASPKMLLFIFEVPNSRLTKMTGTSLILKPHL